MYFTLVFCNTISWNLFSSCIDLFFVCGPIDFRTRQSKQMSTRHSLLVCIIITFVNKHQSWCTLSKASSIFCKRLFFIPECSCTSIVLLFWQLWHIPSAPVLRMCLLVIIAHMCHYLGTMQPFVWCNCDIENFSIVLIVYSCILASSSVYATQCNSLL